MNRVCLVGRTVRNPELYCTSSGTKIVTFTLAVNRKFKNSAGEYESDFIRCKAFNRTAELINEYIGKGDLIGIEGRIQTGSYTDNDGNKRYTTDIFVDSIDFLSQKKKEKQEKEEKEEETAEDPFKDFGEQIDIYDNSYLDD